MKEGIGSAVIVALIIVYCLWVIRGRIRRIRAGKYCGCGCSHCVGQCGKPDGAGQRGKPESTGAPDEVGAKGDGEAL